MIDHYSRNITYLRLSVTELCNLRCRYCMPEDGICKKKHSEIMTEEEMITAVEAAAALGITKVRITGGEPLVKPNILAICRRTAAVRGIKEVCLTTNGTLLSDLAPPLKEAGVQRINLSLDTLDAEKYAYMTRRGKLSDALQGLEAALSAGFAKVKINTVLMGGFNDDEILSLAALTKEYPVDVRFIELMPMGESDDFSEASFLPCGAVLERFPQAIPDLQDNGVAKTYRLPGAKGSIGLISPLSDHFCGRCNRIRLTADGKLKPCLHSAEEYALKGLTIQGMREQFRIAIKAKPPCRPELSPHCPSHAGRHMNQIGG